LEIYEYEITKHITLKFIRLRSGANAIKNKENIVLYLDKESVEKSKKLGFNLSKTFENHLKHLINGYSPVSMQNNANSSKYKISLVGPEEFESSSIAPEATSLDQASRRPHLRTVLQMFLGSFFR
jgi:hypothetical protein